MFSSVMRALAPIAGKTVGGMINEYKNPNQYQPQMAQGGYADGGAINSPYNGTPEGQMSIMPYPMPHYASGGSMYNTLNQLAPINNPHEAAMHHYAMGGYAHGGMPHMGIGGMMSGIWNSAKNMFSGAAGKYGPQVIDFAKQQGQGLLNKGAEYAGNKAGEFVGNRLGGDYGKMAQGAISSGINKYGNQALNQGANYAGNRFAAPQQHPQQQQRPEMSIMPVADGMFRGGYAMGGAPMMSLRDASEMMPQHNNEAIFAPQQSHFSHGGGAY